MHTLYLEADKSIYHPLDIERPDKYKDKFIVLYFGSVLPLQGVDIVLDAAKRLKSVSDLHFIFVGPIKNGGVPENVEHIEWLPQNELAKYISYADLCLAGHFSGSIKKARRTIPGKAYIYQAMEKPMILGDNLANHELFKDGDMFCFVKMGDGEALANAILSRFGRRGEATDPNRS
jgi:glycosyltransferase involved in cell wall biosynthesis